jgi:beta-glucosidase
MADFYKFPDDFLWGCATASYQVEGAAREDGRGPSIWDTFSHSPGRTAFDHTGDVSVDQYHRFRDDIQLMQWLGLHAYRFSVSWSRLFPDGEGEPNAKGFDYYDRLTDALLAARIQPWMTLFHWDLPQALQTKYGGWASRETALRFGDYAAAVSERLSDRVTHFFTINEFMCFTDKGYRMTEFAPGLILPEAQANQARHNALLAHGLAAAALRAHAKRPISVGLAENANIPVPIIETAEHIEASRKAMRLLNAPFLTAVLEGAYMPAYLEACGKNAPVFTEADMKTISTPLDFTGINAYSPVYVRADSARPEGFSTVPWPESYPRMSMPWLYFGPQILYWAVRHASEIWNVKNVYITENGCASDDKLNTSKEVDDTDRLMFVRQYLIAANRAVKEGLPLKGYFLWSLLDNFEWAYGYTKRFGITYVNYETLERIPKLSAKFYREVIARNAVV